MTKISLLLLGCFCLFCNYGQSQELAYGTEHSLTSEILGEERTYWVHLPASYDDPNLGKEHYPVLYVLDGKSAFFPLVGVVNFMGSPEHVNYQIPEVIVIGVDTKERIRDLTPNPSSKMPDGKEAEGEAAKLMFKGSGGGRDFLEFLRKELIPLVNANYRCLPYKVYIGHSLGGLTSTQTMLEHPGVFDAYLAIDPSLWWDGGKYPLEAEKIFKSYPTKPVQRFYLSVIDTVGPAAQSLHFRSIFNMENALRRAAPSNLASKVELIPNTDHSSIPLLSWYKGLSFVFDGFNMSHYAFLQKPQLIKQHFQDLEGKLGLKMDPPQSIFDILSHYLTAPNRFPDADKALEVINMGIEYHPESPLLYGRMGDAYEMKGEWDKSYAAYKKSLDLYPDNKSVQEKFKKIEKRLNR